MSSNEGDVREEDKEMSGCIPHQYHGHYSDHSHSSCPSPPPQPWLLLASPVNKH